MPAMESARDYLCKAVIGRKAVLRVALAEEGEEGPGVLDEPREDWMLLRKRETCMSLNHLFEGSGKAVHLLNCILNLAIGPLMVLFGRSFGD